MANSKKIILLIVVVVAILLIIEVRFLSPQPQQNTEPSNTADKQTPADQNLPSSQRRGIPPKSSDINVPAELQKTTDTNTPARIQRNSDVNAPGNIQVGPDANAPRELRDPNLLGRGAISRGSRRSGPLGERGMRGLPGERMPNNPPEEIGDPNDPFVSVQINNMEMKNIIAKLQEWTGKSIIPSKEAMSARITVFAPNRLPRSKALQLMYSALKMQGYIVEQYDKETLTIRQITDATKLARVPIIDANMPLAAIQNKEEIVQKFFKLKNYKPSQMGQILVPMLGEYGNLSSDDDTRTLGVIDTVRTLMRVETVIQQFDTTAAEPMVEDIFEIRYRNPTEIIQLLQILISDQGTGASSLRNIQSGSGSRERPPEQDPAAIAARRGGSGDRPDSGSPSPSGSRRGGSSTVTSVTVGTGKTPPTLIAEPRNSWIIAKATEKDMELIRKWISKLDTPATIIDSGIPLASIENKNLVAQRFFKLENYSPTLMMQIVKPILNSTSYISAEESTKTLLVMDTVESLIRAERIIQTFDVPGTEQAVPQIFQLSYGDPAEIVQLITMLLSQDGQSGSTRSNPGSISIIQSGSSYRISTSGSGTPSGSFIPSTSSSIIGGSKIPVVLIPYQDRKQIIARAPAEAMRQIAEWIERLDQKESVGSEYDVVMPKYADVSEVAQRISAMLTQMPGQGIQKSVLIQPLVKAGQIMIFGKPELRDMIKKLILEVDIPPGIYETTHFQLKHADPELIKTRIDELYSPTYTGSSGANTTRYQIVEYYTSSSGSSYPSSNMTKDSVRVIADISLRQVTVIASAENMKKIEKQIEEWDVPMDVESLKPRFIECRNVDPVQMAQLLTTLFSENSDSGMTYYQYYGYEDTEAKKKIVGPLYGQLTFEYIPGTKKIIVISKIPEAYDVVEAIVREIDSEEMAEIPTVKTLKFANPERLCEILNATFSEPGASVEILRSESGLGQYSMAGESNGNSGTNSNSNQTAQDGYSPWWSSSVTRSAADNERPISNVIGKIRFVPETRTKSILILSPPEFVKNIIALIDALDVPSKQVMIKAVIVEVDHKNLSSLGVQLATNPSAFGSLEENSIVALNALEQLNTHGSAIWGAAGNQGGVVTNSITANIYGLIDFLEKKVNAKILNQQTLWTQDNEEASFFKGDRVAFYTAATTGTGTSTQNTEFQRVGMNVAVRPSITPNNEVDMSINIIISQLTTAEKNSQPVRTEMETKTTMVVSDGQTLMLGGILFQQDGVTKRGVPGLSDIPLLGGLFSHTEKTLVNNELIVFITPYVYDVDEKTGVVSPEIKKQMDVPLDKLNNIREELNQDVNNMKLVK